MKQDKFYFFPELWLNNKALRTCSAAARGMWLDLLCLMHPNGGYLVVNGQPPTDEKIARMIGEPLKTVRSCIKELGEAGIFSVDDDGRMYSSRMVKSAQFLRNAKKHGAEGQKRKKKISKERSEEKEWPQAFVVKAVKQIEDLVMNEGDPLCQNNPALQALVAPVENKRKLAWYETPAGWVRYGASQAMSIQQGEDIEDFKVRLSARIPPGPHLESLSDFQRNMIESMRPKQ